MTLVFGAAPHNTAARIGEEDCTIMEAPWREWTKSSFFRGMCWRSRQQNGKSRTPREQKEFRGQRLKRNWRLVIYVVSRHCMEFKEPVEVKFQKGWRNPLPCLDATRQTAGPEGRSVDSAHLTLTRGRWWLKNMTHCWGSWGMGANLLGNKGLQSPLPSLSCQLQCACSSFTRYEGRYCKMVCSHRFHAKVATIT